MHAEHGCVLAYLSVCLLDCLSICHTVVLYLNKCIRCPTLSVVWQGHDPSFSERYCRYKIPRESSYIITYVGVGKNLQFLTEIAVYLGNGTI